MLRTVFSAFALPLPQYNTMVGKPGNCANCGHYFTVLNCNPPTCRGCRSYFAQYGENKPMSKVKKRIIAATNVKFSDSSQEISVRGVDIWPEVCTRSGSHHVCTDFCGSLLCSLQMRNLYKQMEVRENKDVLVKVNEHGVSTLIAPDLSRLTSRRWSGYRHFIPFIQWKEENAQSYSSVAV